MGEHPHDTSSRSYMKIISILTCTAGIVGFILYIIFTQSFSLCILRDALSSSSMVWLGLGIISILFSALLHALRFFLLLLTIRPVSWTKVAEISLAGDLLNHFVISHLGDLSEIHWLKQHLGFGYTEGISVLGLRFLHSVLSIMIFSVLIIPFSTHLNGGMHVHGRLIVWGAGIILGLFLIILIVLRLWNPEEKPYSREGLKHKIHTFITDIIKLSKQISPSKHFYLTAIACLEVLTEGLAFALIGIGISNLVNFPLMVWLKVAIAVSIAINVIEYFPTAPATLGFQEWTEAFAIQLSTGTWITFSLTILLHRIIRTVTIGLLGLIPIIFLSGIRIRKN